MYRDVWNMYEENVQTIIIFTILLSRKRSRQHDQAAYAEGLIIRGSPNNKLRITDALESTLLYPDSHYVLSHQGVKKRLFSCSVGGQPMRGF